MKKIIAFFALISVSLLTFAQKGMPIAVYSVPVDSITKKITYEGVVEVKGLAAGDLYHRFADWFKSYYKNPTEVIRENDSTSFRIVGKPRFRLTNPPDKEGTRTDGGTEQYTITVIAKDGRFKYELTDFNWKQLSAFPSERWLDTKSQSYTVAYNDYLQQTDKYVQDLIASLKKAVTEAKPVKNKDNW